MSIFFETGNPCRHPLVLQGRFVSEPAADLERAEASNNDFYKFLQAALGENWYTAPWAYIYGHTHHGGAMPLDPTVLLYNTGGWLRKSKDKPPHTHLFAIDSDGVARMIRADFG